MWKERCRDTENQLAQQREQLRVSGSRRNQAEVSPLEKGTGKMSVTYPAVDRMTTPFEICETS